MRRVAEETTVGLADDGVQAEVAADDEKDVKPNEGYSEVFAKEEELEGLAIGDAATEVTVEEYEREEV
jgi:hypothetical protein